MNDPALPPGFEEDPPLPPGFEVDSPTPGPEAAGPFRQIGRTTKGEPISIPGQDIAAAVTQQPVAAQKGGPMMARVLGLVETGLTMATGIVGGTLGAAGGLAGGMAGSLATGQGGTMQDLEADMAEGARKLTYTPRTPLGRQYAGAVAEAIEPVAQQMGPLAGLSGELTAIGRVAGRGVQKAGDTVAARTTTPAAEAAKTAKQVALEAPQREGIQAARDAGYVLTPQQAKGGKVSRTVAGLSGEPRLEKLASQKNAEVTNRLIREDLQIPEDQPLTREALASRRKAAHEPYDRIKKVGQIQNDEQYMRDLDALSKPYIDAAKDFPELLSNPIVKRVEGLRKPQVNAASAVEVVKDLRNEADKAFRAGDKALGKAYRSAADAVDNSMDRYLNKLTKRVKGAPELAKAVEDYRAARKTIAKTYVADKALNDTTGNVDAAVYARELKKGTKLDGGALTVARAAQQFPQSLQRAEKTGGTGPTYADVLAATVSKEALALGARPAARSVLLSETVQERMAPKSKPKAPTPEPELTAEQGPLPARGEQPPDPRLAAADRDWETVPGAADPRRLEVVPEEGLIPALGEEPPLPQGIPQRPGSQIPLAQEQPLGGPSPDWETAPGAGGGGGRRPDVVPEEGLVPAVDDRTPPMRVRRQGDERALARRAGEEIPAVPGRPGQADTMVAGPPKEVGATDTAGKAMQDALAAIDEFEGKAGGPIPAGEATEVLPSDPRLADIEALKAAATSPAVKKALEAEATKVKKDIKTEQETAQRKADADELRTLAGKTKDAALKQRLLDRAQKLEADEKIPVGEVVEGQPEIKPEKGERSTKPIPVGETTEVPNEPATGRAPEIEKLPTGDAKHITDSGVEEAIPVGEAKELFTPPEKAPAKVDLEVRIEKTPRGEVHGFDKKGDPYTMKVSKQTLGADKKEQSILVEAHDPVSGQRRGFVDFAIRKDGTLVAENVKVAPYLKKRGIAELLYRAARDAGHDIAPGRVQTDDGLALVEALQRKGVINKEADGPRAKASDLLKGEGDASGQVRKQEGVQQERGKGNEGGQAAEAGSGDRVQREAPGGEAKTEVTTWTGKYKKGMTAAGAKDQLAAKVKEQPDLDWKIVPAPDLGKDRFKLEGRKK
jgi:hypothetical protein